MIYVTSSTVDVFPPVNASGGSRYQGGVYGPFVAFGGPLNFTSGPYSGSVGTFFADVNGDESDDAIAVNGSNVTVRLAQP
jgi:hypothetical protein